LVHAEENVPDVEQEFRSRKEEREREIAMQAASLRAERRKHSERHSAAEMEAKEQYASEVEQKARAEELRIRLERLAAALSKEQQGGEPSYNTTAALRSALTAVDAMLVEGLVVLPEDSGELLQETRGKLDDLERAERARERFKAASVALQQAVEVEDIPLLRSCLQESDQAKADLSVCAGQVIPECFGEQVKMAAPA